METNDKTVKILKKQSFSSFAFSVPDSSKRCPINMAFTSIEHWHSPLFIHIQIFNVCWKPPDMQARNANNFNICTPDMPFEGMSKSSSFCFPTVVSHFSQWNQWLLTKNEKIESLKSCSGTSRESTKPGCVDLCSTYILPQHCWKQRWRTWAVVQPAQDGAEKQGQPSPLTAPHYGFQNMM